MLFITRATVALCLVLRDARPMIATFGRNIGVRHTAPRAAIFLHALPLQQLDDAEVASLPSKWVVFTDLHVQRSTLPVCVQLLRKVAAEAQARGAGVICLGDFWHAGGMLQTRALNLVLSEIQAWGDETPFLMIPGNHDQSMRGDPNPLLHALTPLRLARQSSIRVFSQPTLLGDSLWVPFGTSAEELRTACESAESAAGGPLSAIFCHADIVGGLMNEGLANSQGLPPTAFPPLPTRVYSGHYHKPHVVAEPMARGRYIRYAGSPYQTSMAEAGQRKALLVLDRDAGWAVQEEIPLDIGPRHHLVRYAPGSGIDAGLAGDQSLAGEFVPAGDAASSLAASSLAELSSTLRAGDRVILLTDASADDPTLARFAKQHRPRGVSVELRRPAADGAAAASAAASLAAAASGASSGQVDLMQPAALFGAYADAKNVSTAVLEAGTALVDAAAAEAGRTAPAPVHLELKAVAVEGYGSFAQRVEYPLDQRGMLLLRGTHAERDAAAAAARASAAAADAAAVESELDESGMAGSGVEASDASTAALEAGDESWLALVEVDGNELLASNGAGKTTLAMAPLWALTGGTDARADGKPIEARGVINDGASRAVVTLTGAIHRAPAAAANGANGGAAPGGAASGGAKEEGGGGGGSCDGSVVPFEVVRTMGRREHTLQFTVGETICNGTLAQVQEQLDAVLRANQLARESLRSRSVAAHLWVDAALRPLPCVSCLSSLALRPVLPCEHMLLSLPTQRRCRNKLS